MADAHHAMPLLAPLRVAALLLAVSLGVAAPARAGELPRLFLSQIPVVNLTGKPFHFDKPFVVHLHVQEPAESHKVYAERFADAVVEGDAVRFRYDRYTAIRTPAVAANRESTFVVDFRDATFAALKDAAVRQYGKSPTGAQLSEFVFRYIEKKDMARPFDVASVVVRRKEGDCSEHAVLLAALTRAFGMSSRVVNGIVFLASGAEMSAYAHAWVEVAGPGGWVPLDGTRPDAAIDRTYLPMYVMTDETMRYGIAMFEPFRLTMPKKIDVE